MYQKHETRRTEVEKRKTFGTELRDVRVARGLSLTELAARTHYSRAHLANVEHGRRAATTELAEACDTALEAGGELLALIPRPRQSDSEATVARPAQLPAAPGRFVGRSAQLSALDAVSDKADRLSIATVHGLPGVGKTTLALYWAHREIGRFPDGQLFADLRGHSGHQSPASPAEILEDFLISLGLTPADVPPSEEKRAALFRTMTHDRRMLVVLDNAVSTDQVRPLLPGAAGSTVLVTSRVMLTGLVVRAGATQLGLAPFTADDSLRFLREVVGPRVDDEPLAAQAVLDRCGHLPLAVAVAAERIAAHPIRLAELAEDLAEERQRLAALASDEDADVRAVFSWSYRALPTAAARMFRVLGLHPGKEISVPAAAALADMESGQAAHLLRTLAMCHLVEEADRDHFWLHDLLRVYATEQALAVDSPEDIERAQVRELSWYLDTATAAGLALEPFRSPSTDTALPGYAEAFAWCEREMASFPSVVGLALRIGHPELASRISQALFSYFHLRKPWTIWERTYHLGLEAASKLEDPCLQADMLTGLGLVELGLGKPESGREAFRRGLDLLENEGEPTRSAWCHIGIGLAYADMEDVEAARNALERGMVIHRGQHDQHAESVALVHLADLCRGEKHTEDALRYAGRALSLCRSIDDKYGEGLSLYQLGMTYLAADLLDDALNQLEAALSVQQAACDDKGQADTLWALARTSTARGDNTTARRRLEEAADIFERRGDPAEAVVRAGIANLEDGAAK
ncbi:Helix-turn-helix domain-containing protein [Amycolatopsis pretoriensis]|uniref:Helix-turn-helix domain-containing protein n=1 Tax=Amycolatopsis pretoriensis TaxID=218821 RepID=A0A1H5RJ52_9PSEU|nr:helix-turn-helix domain-containing protein [Amycolatopsis pretoriensis]SEF38392.1 Helix-turn-helix domain-containing protein [Amycolatopsis pretoriensis]